MVMTRNSKRRVEEEQQQQRQKEESSGGGLQLQFLALPSPQVFPSSLDCSVQRDMTYPQSVTSSRVAKRIEKCRRLSKVVLKVADTLIPANGTSELTPYQKSHSNAFPAQPATITSPLAEEPPLQLLSQVKVHSPAASEIYHRRARRIPCSRHKSTAEKGTLKKENYDTQQGNGTHMSTPLSDGIHDIDIHASAFHIGVEGVEEIQPIVPVEIPLGDVNDELVSKSPLITQATNAINHSPLGEVTKASPVTQDRPEVSGNSHSEAESTVKQATSINLSGMAELLDDDCSSFNSELNDALVTVDGYRVRQDLAPILRDILAKHGDIAAHCRKKSAVLCSLLLESICNVVQKLQATEFVYLTPTEIDGLQVLVQDIESDDIQVRWLHHRLDEIRSAKQLLKESPQLKQTKNQRCHTAKRIEEEIEASEREMHMLEHKINSLKAKLIEVRAEEKKLDERLTHTKALVKKFHSGSMIDDLL